jgi:hypothetical protein
MTISSAVYGKNFKSISSHSLNLDNIYTNIHAYLFGCSMDSTYLKEKSNIFSPLNHVLCTMKSQSNILGKELLEKRKINLKYGKR